MCVKTKRKTVEVQMPCKLLLHVMFSCREYSAGALSLTCTPFTMATDSISGGKKSHARRVTSTGSCGFQL